MKPFPFLALVAICCGTAKLIAIVDALPGADAPALPSAFVTASDALFADGMADPRGGTYRVITVRVGDVWSGKGAAVATHGWIMPSKTSADPKRAVAWNGLTYTVIADTGPADLATDVEALLKQDSDLRARSLDAQFPYVRLDNAVGEAASIDIKRLSPVTAALLSRVGEKKLGENVYAAWLDGIPPHVNSDDRDRADPFVRMAGDWAWALFDRAVCAHMRGDDRLALDDAVLLEAAGPKLEAQAAARGIARPLSTDRSSEPLPYFGFLNQVPALAADSRRRIAAPDRPLDLIQLKASHKTPAQHVALLISQLDEVAARQSGQPGGVGLDSDPISEALIAEGDAAVDPLLDAMQNDKRLTRSVSFGRDFFRQRNLLTVRSAAGACIVRILHTSQFSPNYQPSVEEIRAYWNANRGIPLAERWYRTLNDDSATPRQWLEAASNIVQPADVERQGMWISSPVRTAGAPPPPMRGASLRSHNNPSVSTLLARRVAEIAGDNWIPSGPNAEFRGGSYIYADGITLGLYLAEWDLKGALPTLKLLMDRVRRVHPGQEANGSFDQIGQRAAKLTIARMRAGDPSAASDYIEFLHGIPAGGFGFRAADALRPFIELPRNAEFGRAAEELFDGAPSAWNPVAPPLSPGSRSAYGRDEIIGSELICVPAFRRQVIRELDDQRTAGTGSVADGGQIRYERNGASGSFGGGNSTPPVMPVGTTFTFRLCDLYAWKVTTLRSAPLSRTSAFGMPQFELCWPRNKRDEAITALKAYLVRFGDSLVAMPNSSQLSAFYVNGGVIFRLPPLPRAATDADVQEGRAIFSLNDPSARPVSLASPFPVAARWASNTAPGQVVTISTADGHNTTVVRPDSDGVVVQAEETVQDGKGHRFYGFIGKQTIAKVPAAEIVFLDDIGRPLPEKTAVSGKSASP